MFEKLPESEGKHQGFKVKGVMHKEDYDKLLPELISTIMMEGEINLLFDLSEFEGTTIKAEEMDLGFVREFKDIVKKMAFVSDKKWEKVVEFIYEPFTNADIKFFPEDQLDQAWAWLKE
ncbi:STAS/SEC14 domain-containing protein [Patescibacteria group bacterium]|nr:STAS/SEC14 domain-containing protein [Patescibacteria group bacterium]MBU1673467.1 STAS/SEC14 domain-containing protein [Patescibacteria group bacterium]MBU1962911.1 STAS/SEC14 domain-containing protein [Patescibacteria group bacterium]